jgi:hypothetical protein
MGKTNKGILMKKVSMFLIGIMLVFVLGCGVSTTPPSADTQQARKTEQLQAESNRQVGMPNIKNFTQKKTLKMIQEACDQEDLITYAYFFNEIEGKVGDPVTAWGGKCIGFGVPFSAQYTNPERLVAKGVNYGYLTLPQPDPNGIFMPTSSSATWLLVLDKENNPRPVYFEPTIIVSPFPLK